MQPSRRISSLLCTTTPSRYFLRTESQIVLHQKRLQSSTTGEIPIESSSSDPAPSLFPLSQPFPARRSRSYNADSKQKKPTSYANTSRGSIFRLRYQPMGSSTQWLQEYINSSGVVPTLDHWRLFSKKSDLYRIPLTRAEFDDIITGNDTIGVPNWSTNAIHRRQRDLKRMRESGVIEKTPYILSVTGQEIESEEPVNEQDATISLHPPTREDDIGFEALFETIIGLKPQYLLRMLGYPQLKRLRNEYVHNLVKFGLEDGILGVKTDGQIFVGQVHFLRKLEAVGLDKSILQFYHVNRETHEIKFDFVKAKHSVRDYSHESKPVSPQLHQILKSVATEEEGFSHDQDLLAKEARYFVESVQGIPTIPEIISEPMQIEPFASTSSSTDAIKDSVASTKTFNDDSKKPSHRDELENTILLGLADAPQTAMEPDMGSRFQAEPETLPKQSTEDSTGIISTVPHQSTAALNTLADDNYEQTISTPQMSLDPQETVEAEADDSIETPAELTSQISEYVTPDYVSQVSHPAPVTPKRNKPKRDELLEDLQEAFTSSVTKSKPSQISAKQPSASSTPAPFVDDGYEYLRRSLAASTQSQEKEKRNDEDSDDESDSDSESDEEEDFPRPRRPF